MENKKYGAAIGDVMDWFKTMVINKCRYVVPDIEKKQNIKRKKYGL